MAATAPPAPRSSMPSIGSLVRRPEMGSLIGMIAVLVFFSIFGGANFMSAGGAASWLNVASELGIIALPVGLLMIAGHLDLSVGSMVPASSMTIAIVSGHYGAPIIVGILAALGLGLAVGFINGRAGDPHQGAVLRRHAGDAVRAGRPDARPLGHPDRQHQRRAARADRSPSCCSATIVGGKFQVTLFWWIAVVLIVGFILNFSRYGNWILAMGGDASAPATPASRPTG